MRPNQETVGCGLTEFGIQNESPQSDESNSEHNLAARISHLDKIVETLQGALPQQSISGEPLALDLVNDLHVKIAASNNLFRVARLLSEPARESMVSEVRASVQDLEKIIASHFGADSTQAA